MVTALASALTAARRPRTGPPRPAMTASAGRSWPALVLAGLAVLAQVLYPLLEGRALTWLTILSVLLFAAAVTAHAALTAGTRSAAVLAVVAPGIGLAAELIGTATGVPFGPYSYAGTLGASIDGVPLVIPVAWIMLAWPALIAARTLTPPGTRLRHAGIALTGGWVMTSWDLFLDPQMTAAGHWSFDRPDPGLPGVPGIPLTNYAGWLLVSVIVVVLLDRMVPEVADRTTHTIPALLLGWTWLGSTMANLVFFDRPVVALYGGVGMGLAVAPYLLRLLRRR